MEIPEEQFARMREKLATAKTIEDLTGKDGALREVFATAINNLLEAELTTHLGYSKHSPEGNNSGNSRNGRTRKRLATQNGQIEIDVPRDRNGSFEPIVVRKHQRRLGAIGDAVIAMYARGASTRDIQAHMMDIYGVEISPATISEITDEVLPRIAEWQNRPLDPCYPFVFFDAVQFKVRQEGKIVSKAAFTCLAVSTEGMKELLGIWIAPTEGAHSWMTVLTELRTRGVNDIFFAIVDGLPGFPEMISGVFPSTQVQRCIIHQIRSSMQFVTWKDSKAVMRDMKAVYRSTTREAAESALVDLEANWGEKYPAMAKSWNINWPALSTYLDYIPEIRRMLYTTNAVEAVHRQFRKVMKTKTVFPNDEALRKMLYLSGQIISAKWDNRIPNWPIIASHLAVSFHDRWI